MASNTIQFSKMHGLGNDFMVIEQFNQSVALTPKQIYQWSNRQTGVGFDQLLLLSPHERYDAQYQIFNADGSEVEQCGNGARCVAKFLWDHQLVQSKDMIVMTKTRPIHLHYEDDDHIEVEMGIAKVASDLLTFTFDDYKVQGILIDVGNPHFLIEESLSESKLEQVGSQLQKMPHFDGGVNVSFIDNISEDTIEILTYERGVGITEACGSAACAAAYNKAKLTSANTLTVRMKGGDVQIQVREDDTLLMRGPAREVFRGTSNI